MTDPASIHKMYRSGTYNYVMNLGIFLFLIVFYNCSASPDRYKRQADQHNNNATGTISMGGPASAASANASIAATDILTTKVIGATNISATNAETLVLASSPIAADPNVHSQTGQNTDISRGGNGHTDGTAGAGIPKTGFFAKLDNTSTIHSETAVITDNSNAAEHNVPDIGDGTGGTDTRTADNVGTLADITDAAAIDLGTVSDDTSGAEGPDALQTSDGVAISDTDDVNGAAPPSTALATTAVADSITPTEAVDAEHTIEDSNDSLTKDTATSGTDDTGSGSSGGAGATDPEAAAVDNTISNRAIDAEQNVVDDISQAAESRILQTDDNSAQTATVSENGDDSGSGTRGVDDHTTDPAEEVVANDVNIGANESGDTGTILDNASNIVDSNVVLANDGIATNTAVSDQGDSGDGADDGGTAAHPVGPATAVVENAVTGPANAEHTDETALMAEPQISPTSDDVANDTATSADGDTSGDTVDDGGTVGGNTGGATTSNTVDNDTDISHVAGVDTRVGMPAPSN